MTRLKSSGAVHMGMDSVLGTSVAAAAEASHDFTTHPESLRLLHRHFIPSSTYQVIHYAIYQNNNELERSTVTIRAIHSTAHGLESFQNQLSQHLTNLSHMPWHPVRFIAASLLAQLQPSALAALTCASLR